MIRQFVVIFGFLAVGEAIVAMTDVKLPSSIIGMLLLTVSLKLGWIKLAWVKGISDFLLTNIAFLFVPSGVAIMLYMNMIEPNIVAIVIAMVTSTVIVLVVTGRVHQLLRKWL